MFLLPKRKSNHLWRFLNPNTPRSSHLLQNPDEGVIETWSDFCTAKTHLSCTWVVERVSLILKTWLPSSEQLKKGLHGQRQIWQFKLRVENLSSKLLQYFCDEIPKPCTTTLSILLCIDAVLHNHGVYTFHLSHSTIVVTTIHYVESCFYFLGGWGAWDRGQRRCQGGTHQFIQMPSLNTQQLTQGWKSITLGQRLVPDISQLQHIHRCRRLLKKMWQQCSWIRLVYILLVDLCAEIVLSLSQFFSPQKPPREILSVR
jgi:hypothetical protein